MRAILGDNFCYSPKEELLKEVGRNNGASPDIADLQHKRYVIFTELGGTIKLTSFRRLTGGDQLTGRQLFQGNNHFYLHATLVGEFNNPPDFDAKAMDADYRRTIDFGFKINYTDDPDKIDKTINGVSYLKADPYYSSPEFINEASPYLLDLLLDKYKEFYSVEKKLILFDIPEDIRRASKSLVDGTNVFKQICDELYEEVAGETLTAKEIWSEIQYHDKYKMLGKTAKRQYNMKALYEWVGGVYVVEGDGNYQALTIKNIRRKM
jgi:phage/plasmid-associated DNA primase